MSISRTLMALTLTTAIAACQGMPSEKPPVHVNPNMDWQDRFNAQEVNPFFEDNRADRQPVEGTVSRGDLQADIAYYQGIVDNGNFVSKIPATVSAELIMRGKERYNIYCSMCHGGTGVGNGIITNYGIVPPPSFYDERIVNMPDGEIYSAIYNGVRTMSSYRHQIPVEDRWAIVSYIRTLQRSNAVTEQELVRFGTSANQIRSASGNEASAE
jgi:mono/diheme cytochrome c family protein